MAYSVHRILFSNIVEWCGFIDSKHQYDTVYTLRSTIGVSGNPICSCLIRLFKTHHFSLIAIPSECRNDSFLFAPLPTTFYLLLTMRLPMRDPATKTSGKGCTGVTFLEIVPCGIWWNIESITISVLHVFIVKHNHLMQKSSSPPELLFSNLTIIIISQVYHL